MIGVTVEFAVAVRHFDQPEDLAIARGNGDRLTEPVRSPALQLLEPGSDALCRDNEVVRLRAASIYDHRIEVATLPIGESGDVGIGPACHREPAGDVVKIEECRLEWLNAARQIRHLVEQSRVVREADPVLLRAVDEPEDPGCALAYRHPELRPHLCHAWLS